MSHKTIRSTVVSRIGRLELQKSQQRKEKSVLHAIRCPRGRLVVIGLLLGSLMTASSTIADTPEDRSEKAAGLTNEVFDEAMQIITSETFRDYVRRLGASQTLLADEKRELNDKLRPMCRDGIFLLRKAYKMDPQNPDINAELVKLLFLDLSRILHIGLNSERVQTFQTGFEDENGKFVSGYPSMIEYHAERCRQNDHAGKYSKMLDDILVVLSK